MVQIVYPSFLSETKYYVFFSIVNLWMKYNALHFFMVLLLNTLKNIVYAITNKIMDCLVPYFSSCRNWHLAQERKTKQMERSIMHMGSRRIPLKFCCMFLTLSHKLWEVIVPEKEDVILWMRAHLTTERYCLHLHSNLLINHLLNSALTIITNRFALLLPMTIFKHGRMYLLNRKLFVTVYFQQVLSCLSCALVSYCRSTAYFEVTVSAAIILN